jgi:bifunctional ADP-heptose synthase (sugar kinase/adenylyltransferase)
MVDLVTFFDQDTPAALIEVVRPDVLVKGGDWTPDRIVGADFVLAHGGTVRSLPYKAGYSTTDLIRRSRKAEGRR